MKLVRDKIPQISEENGDGHKFYRERLVEWLPQKAIEELSEVFSATGDEHVVEECADVLEVLVTIARNQLWATREEAIERIVEFMNEKYEERGGFEEGWVMYR